MSLSLFLNVTVSGLIVGAVYALVLLGILMVYRVSKAVNFAHGALGMFAAFSGYYFAATQGWPWPLAIIVGLVLGAVIAAGTGRLLEFIPKGANGYDLVTTLGLLLLLTAVAQSAFGVNTYSYPALWGNKQFSIPGGLQINGNDLLVLGLVAISFLAFYLVLARSQIGLSIRAVAENPTIAASLSINVGATRTVVWTLAGLIAGVGGVIAASRTSVDALYMTPFLLKAFVAGIIGGLDRFVAPLAIAFGVGVYENWTTYFFGANDSTPAVFILIVVALSIAPRRFLEERHEARA